MSKLCIQGLFFVVKKRFGEIGYGMRLKNFFWSLPIIWKQFKEIEYGMKMKTFFLVSAYNMETI